MKLKNAQLIDELIEITNQNIQQVQAFKELVDSQLNYKINPSSWSILECIEHLNFYGDFYLPEIDKQIKRSKHRHGTEYKPGWLGNYFANSMKPKEKLNKMKTFKEMNPINSKLTTATLDKFLEQQQKLLVLLEESRKIHLGKTKTAISISKMIQLKLGDTLRFFTYHNERHIVQAQKVLKSL
ncbi:MAG TPA: DinB family protein [Taishania sp.]|nr:DinB family protein [Taishania sp.]